MTDQAAQTSQEHSGRVRFDPDFEVTGEIRGTVFATVRATGRQVVLKPLHHFAEPALPRLLQRIRHPGLPCFYAHWFEPGTCQTWTVMEHLPGEALSALQQTRVHPATCQFWFEACLAVLEDLSLLVGQPVLHLDLKPEHLVVLPSGQPALIDFASACLLPPGVEQTRLATVRGTPRFAAPELFAGVVHRNSDRYSLALVFLSLLTGEIVECLNPVQLNRMLSRVPQPFAAILARNLARDPAQRSTARQSSQGFIPACPVCGPTDGSEPDQLPIPTDPACPVCGPAGGSARSNGRPDPATTVLPLSKPCGMMTAMLPHVQTEQQKQLPGSEDAAGNRDRGGTMDLDRIEKAVREILLAVGEDPDRPGLVETPGRVARMYEEVFSGLAGDVSEQIKLFDEPGNDDMILVGDIPFYSMCEHHLLPFLGKAHVVYIPRDGRIFGLSKIARIVTHLAQRPQLQERLTMEIADLINQTATPQGVCVVLEAEHLCMTMRGIKKPGSVTVTSAVRGICRSDAKSRGEAMNLIWRSSQK